MKFVIAIILAYMALVGSFAAAYGQSKDRGQYIYDEAERLPLETEIALASYLWKLDNKTGYELVYILPKTQLTEQQMIAEFNRLQVGKKGKDTGAAVFVLPDNSVFVSIGSGNDKVSVTMSKTKGEQIFKGLQDDLPLTFLRFSSSVSGSVDTSSDNFVSKVAHPIISNWNVVILWGALFALIAFVAMQWDGFQVTDFLAPAGVLVILILAFGVDAAAGGKSSGDNYSSYGVITKEAHSTYDWVSSYEVCTTTGGQYPVTTCNTYYVNHTDYRNDVSFRTYEETSYNYRFVTTDGKGAWTHNVGELDRLTIRLKDKTLVGVGDVDDKSGGKTIGDGVWIYAGKK